MVFAILITAVKKAPIIKYVNDDNDAGFIVLEGGLAIVEMDPYRTAEIIKDKYAFGTVYS